MPTQNNIIKDQKVVVDDWQLIPADYSGDITLLDKVILPLELFLTLPSKSVTEKNISVWISNDIDLAEVAEKIISLPIIAIDFPSFMDGRGFSLARLLRERYNYEGDIRAIGHVIRDQLCYLKRCGVSSFKLADDVNLENALESLNDFSEAYQISVDMPSPLFRRRMH